MLLEVIGINIVDVHVFDVFHKIRFLCGLSRFFDFLSFYQDCVAFPYVNFLPIIIARSLLLGFPLFESALPLALDRPLSFLIAGFFTLAISYCATVVVDVDISLKPVLIQVDFFTFFILFLLTIIFLFFVIRVELLESVPLNFLKGVCNQLTE